MFVAHALKLGYKLADVVDVGSKIEYDGRQGPRLPSIFEIDSIEIVVQLGVFGQHRPVENRRDPLSMLPKDRDGVLDQFCLLISESHGADG